MLGKQNVAILLTIIIAGASAGCWRGGLIGEDIGSPDDDIDGDADTDSDSDSDSDGDTDVDTEELPNQGPIDFIVENQGDVPLYVNWIDVLTYVGPVFECLVEGDDDWLKCSYNHYPYSPSCSDVEPGASCCEWYSSEDQLPFVAEILPGKTFVYTWDAELHTLDPDYCSECQCDVPYDPLAGHYRVAIDVFESIECYVDWCTDPDEDGIIWGASLVGEPLVAVNEFDIPYSESELVLIFE